MTRTTHSAPSPIPPVALRHIHPPPTRKPWAPPTVRALNPATSTHHNQTLGADGGVDGKEAMS